MVVKLRCFKLCRKTGLKFVAIRGAVLVAPPNRIMTCDLRPALTKHGAPLIVFFCLLERHWSGLARFWLTVCGLRNKTLMETRSLALGLGGWGAATCHRTSACPAHYVLRTKTQLRWGAVQNVGDCFLLLGVDAIGPILEEGIWKHRGVAEVCRTSSKPSVKETACALSLSPHWQAIMHIDFEI